MGAAHQCRRHVGWRSVGASRPPPLPCCLLLHGAMLGMLCTLHAAHAALCTVMLRCAALHALMLRCADLDVGGQHQVGEAELGGGPVRQVHQQQAVDLLAVLVEHLAKK